MRNGQHLRKEICTFHGTGSESYDAEPVTGICIITRLSDGSVFTQYHNSNMMDKMTYAGVIQQDVTLDMLKANNMVGEDPPQSAE